MNPPTPMPTPSPTPQTITPEFPRPPIGTVLHERNCNYCITVSEHTARGFKYTGAPRSFIPRMGLSFAGGGEVFVDTPADWRLIYDVFSSPDSPTTASGTGTPPPSAFPAENMEQAAAVIDELRDQRTELKRKSAGTPMQKRMRGIVDGVETSFEYWKELHALQTERAEKAERELAEAKECIAANDKWHLEHAGNPFTVPGLSKTRLREENRLLRNRAEAAEALLRTYYGAGGESANPTHGVTVEHVEPAPEFRPDALKHFNAVAAALARPTHD